MQAGRAVKEEGRENDLLERIAADPAFRLSLSELKKSLRPERYIGRAPEQVEEFLRDFVRPLLEENRELLGMKAEIKL